MATANHITISKRRRFTDTFLKSIKVPEGQREVILFEDGPWHASVGPSHHLHRPDAVERMADAHARRR